MNYRKIWLLVLGYAVHGLFMGFVYVPLLPELIEAIEDATG